MTHAGDVFEEPRQRERPVGKMYDEQPSAEDINQVVQAVGVGDAVDGGEQSEPENQGVRAKSNAVNEWDLVNQ